jgi:DNA-binding LacI/PurR family transcriptional regulator
MAISMKDVAKYANVSIATVSRVLSNKPHVRPEVRQRVLKAIDSLGYKPSRLARSLRMQTSCIIGLIISDIQNPFFTSLVRAVEDRAYQEQHAVFLCNSDEDIEKERLYIELMLAERVAGVVITPTQEKDNPSSKLLEAKIPVVSVDRRMLDLEVDTVVVDNIRASRDLVEHLIQDGHRRIGPILGSFSITTGRERRLGYTAALRSHGIAIDKDLIRTGLPKEEMGYQCACQLLDLPEPPTAIFTGNNLLTIGALRAIQERKLRIPEDVGIAAFDEMRWASLIEPPLTVVKQPTYELGWAATDLLLKRIREPERAVQEIILKPPLCIRQSCAPHEDPTQPIEKT